MSYGRYSGPVALMLLLIGTMWVGHANAQERRRGPHAVRPLGEAPGNPGVSADADLLPLGCVCLSPHRSQHRLQNRFAKVAEKCRGVVMLLLVAF